MANALPTEAPTKVVVGLRFRSVVADARVLWEVTEHVAKDVWEAVVLNEPMIINGVEYESDFVGKVDVFKEADILGPLRMSAMFGGYDPANYEVQTHTIS